MKPLAELSCAWERNTNVQATGLDRALSGTVCQTLSALTFPSRGPSPLQQGPLRGSLELYSYLGSHCGSVGGPRESWNNEEAQSPSHGRDPAPSARACFRSLMNQCL